MRLSEAHGRALKQVVAGDDRVCVVDLAWLLEQSLVEPFTVSGGGGACLALDLTLSGGRVLKEETERAAMTVVRNQEEES